MRIITLEMCAFGTFADKTVIDFTRLPKSGIYLITGKTGAGKTTVFDAITYALFGTPSGNSRTRNNLRSKYADDSTPTYVQLEFEYNGQRYTVRRNSEYLRKKARGSGTTIQPACAELQFSDSRAALVKEKDVDEEIVKILGLTREQFTQIAMIAQGDFQRMLLADTKARIPIFRSIFNTYRYQRFEEDIKAKQLSLDREIEKMDALANQLIMSISCSDSSENFAKITEIKTNPDSFESDEILDALFSVIDEDKAKKDSSDKAVTEIQGELDRLNKELGRAKQRQTAIDEIDKNEKLIKKLEPLLTEKKQAAEEQEKLSPKREKIAVEAQKASDSLRDYDELERLNIAAKNSFEELRRLKIKSDELTKNELEIKKQIDEFSQKLTEFPDLSKSEIDARLALDECERRAKKIDKLAQKYELYKAKKIEYQKKKADYQTAKALSDEIQEKYNAANTAFLNAQAGILASELEDGKKCPVCGSVHHPSPAAMPDCTPTQSEVENLKLDYDKKSADSADLSALCGQKYGVLISLGDEIKKDTEDLFGETDDIPKKIEFEKTDCSKRLENHLSALKNIKRQIAEKQKIEQKIPLLQTKREEFINSGTKVKSLTGAVTERIDNLQKSVDKLKSTLEFASKAEAEKHAQSLILKKQAMESRLKAVTEDYRKTNEQYTAAKSAVSTLKKQTDGIKIIDINSLNEQLTELQAKKDELSPEIQKLAARLSQNKDIYARLGKHYSDMGEKRKSAAAVRELSLTANGRLAGKDRIDLETYIQMAFFDRILVRANRRLLAMSNRKYTLKRRENPDNKKALYGLDIDVVDHTNASTRAVSTLSGGESFLASLSLALGLSDEIQYTSGGIKLDSMFVDEGFGTLDDETLNCAMNALITLSKDDKMIGIISHVNELKNRIDHRIEVTKGPDGTSTVHISD